MIEVKSGDKTGLEARTHAQTRVVLISLRGRMLCYWLAIKECGRRAWVVEGE